MKFKVGDRVRRVGEVSEYDRAHLNKGDEHFVSSIHDWDEKTDRYSIRLSGTGIMTWDAWKFEYVSPWVQSCSCGIHWTECEEHKR